MVREICKANDVEMVKGHISRDHIHIFVSVSPHISVSDLVKSVKGKTSRKLLMECKTLSRPFGAVTHENRDILQPVQAMSLTK